MKQINQPHKVQSATYNICIQKNVDSKNNPKRDDKLSSCAGKDAKPSEGHSNMQQVLLHPPLENLVTGLHQFEEIV